MTTLTAWSPPFLLAPTEASGSRPELLALGNGTFVGFWKQGGSLSFKIFNADGTAKTAEIPLEYGEGLTEAYEPSLTLLSNGTFVVTWSYENGYDAETGSGIRGQVFTSDGLKFGQDFRINSTIADHQFEPSVTALSGGGFAVAYGDIGGDGSSSCIRTQVFSQSGQPLNTSDIIANATTALGQTSPVVTALQDGGYAVFFNDYSQGPDDPNTTIRGRFFNADGTPAGTTDFLVPTSMTGAKEAFAATTLANGNVVVTWQSTTGDSSGEGVKAQIFSPTGTKIGTEFTVNQVEDGRQSDPVVRALNDGGFAVAYISNGASSEVRVATFTSDGTPVDDIAVVIPEESALEGSLDMTTMADGRLVVSWDEWNVGASTAYVRAQILDPRGQANVFSGTMTDDQHVGTAFNDILFGADGNDRFWGGGGHDVLDGGAGADTLIGGAGNDIYYIDQSDVIIEEAGGGYDVLMASYNAALQDNGHIEELQAIAGTWHINLTGANTNDTLFGNWGNNVLNGGTGADKMSGNAGNDTYYVDNVGDRAVETGDDNGFDQIFTSVSYTLGDYVENLFALGASGISLTGNGSHNVLAGNAGRNDLRGGEGNDTLGGGYGNDTLRGDAGRDIFVFNTKLGTSKTDRKKNFDKITDFNVKNDTIWLDNKYFKKLGKGSESKPGKLNKKFFSLDTAKDKNDYLIYSKKTGVLSYDADGSGKGKAVEFAQLKKYLKLTYKDFFVI